MLLVLDAHMQVASNITNLRESGKIEQAASLSAALQNGTLKIQDARAISDLTVKDNKIFFDDGGGIGGAIVTSVGKAKQAIDNAGAIILRLGDRGDYFVEW